MPASRPASFLQPAIDLAASLDTLLVVLCSKQTNIEHVAQRARATPGSRCLIVPVPADWTHPYFPSGTADSSFAEAKAGRATDLSKKRNLGLLLARLHRWNKIAFVDDDITLSKTDNVARLAGQLDVHQIAGMVLRQFPDNSVVCHARRLAGAPQDVFITGAVLGVQCNDLPLSFFPDIYNEDWFFFAEEAAKRRVRGVGQAVQAEYDPFASPTRARWEEFGDLLAEGLFALFTEWDTSQRFSELLGRASRTYWSDFIEARHEVLENTWSDLLLNADRDPGDRRIYAALESVSAARVQLERAITADLCVNFVDAYQDDLRQWHRDSSAVKEAGSTHEAMDFLGLTAWRLTGFGTDRVNGVRQVSRLADLATV